MKKEQFKKGDYVVLIGEKFSDHGTYPRNHVYLQTEDNVGIHGRDAEGDMNGWYTVNINSEKGWEWRYATDQEISHYRKVKRVYNISELPKQLPIFN